MFSALIQTLALITRALVLLRHLYLIFAYGSIQKTTGVAQQMRIFLVIAGILESFTPYIL